jgi:5-methyltetrahydropteroyltriglutamate--homocysteine methyltransferase
MNAASPGVIALFQPNDYYPDDDAYLEALAEAMRPEYEAVAAAGLRFCSWTVPISAWAAT